MSDMVGNPEDRFSRVAAHLETANYAKNTDQGRPLNDTFRNK